MRPASSRLLVRRAARAWATAPASAVAVPLRAPSGPSDRRPTASAISFDILAGRQLDRAPCAPRWRSGRSTPLPRARAAHIRGRHQRAGPFVVAVWASGQVVDDLRRPAQQGTRPPATSWPSLKMRGRDGDGLAHYRLGRVAVGRRRAYVLDHDVNERAGAGRPALLASPDWEVRRASRPQPRLGGLSRHRHPTLAVAPEPWPGCRRAGAVAARGSRRRVPDDVRWLGTLAEDESVPELHRPGPAPRAVGPPSGAGVQPALVLGPPHPGPVPLGRPPAVGADPPRPGPAAHPGGPAAPGAACRRTTPSWGSSARCTTTCAAT